MHLWIIIYIFYKDYPKKPIATSSLLNSAPPMAKPSVKPIKHFAKQKQGRPTGLAKQIKEWDLGRWSFFFLVLVKLEDFFTNSMSFEKDAYLASFFNSPSSLFMSSTLLLSFLFMSNTLPLRSLFMSGILPPIFHFSSLIYQQVRRFFIKLILKFSSSVFYWVRRFFIHYALPTKLRKLYPYTPTHLVKFTFYSKGNCNIMIFKIEIT